MLAPFAALMMAPPAASAMALASLTAMLLVETAPPPAPAPAEPASLITTSASVALSAEWLETRSTTTASAATSARGSVATPAVQEAKVRLVYTGGSGGIGSGRYDFGIARLLTRRLIDDGGRLIDATPYHGVLARGLHVMIASDRRVATLSRMFAQGGIRCGEPSPVRSVRTHKARILVEGSQVPDMIGALPAVLSVAPYEKRRCTSAGGDHADLYGPAGKPMATEWLTLGELEFRLGLHLELATATSSTTTAVQVIGVPADDPARRYRALRDLVDGEDVLYVDAGSFVDGASSILDGQLSLHRPLGLDMLARLHPAALAPGETELVGGAANLIAELRAHHLPYVATNWVSEDPALELPTVRFAQLDTPLGLARIAFLGAVDPAIAQQVPLLAAEKVTLTDPLAALSAEVLRLQTSTAPPDLIVVLTTARWQIYEAIQTEVRGIDLVIGETSPIENRMRAAELDLRPSTAKDRLSASIMPLFGVAVTELSLVRAPSGRLMLRKITIEPHRLIESLEPDPEVMARVTDTRARTYPALDRPLVRPPGDLADPLSKGLWSRLVCETVRQRTGADVVLLPELPALVDVLGPQTELLALNGLASFDKLEAHVIRGKKLVDLLRDAPAVTPVACGGQIGVRAPKVLGRAVDEARSYTLVSTDRARLNGLGALIGDGYGTRLLDPRDAQPVLDDHQRPLSLRTAVLAALREARDGASEGTAPIEALAQPSETTKANLYLLRINRLALSLSSFVSADQKLPEVKETRAHAPSALTIGVDGDLQLVLDLTEVTGELRALVRYAEATVFATETTPQTKTEQADDARFSGALTVPALRTSIGRVGWLPYGEISFDTELTPITDDANRQAALFFTGGLSFDGVPTLTLARVGASVGRDFSLAVPYAFSLRTELESNITFGWDLGLKLRAVGDWFAPTDADTDANLRFGYAFEGRLALPLARWLNLGAFAQTYLFRGAQVSRVEAAHTLGLALDLSGAFEL